MEPEMQQVQNSPIGNPIGFPGSSTPSVPQQSPKSNWKWLLLLILFLLVIGGVTFFVFKSSRSNSADASSSPEATADLSQVSTPEPTPTSTPADKTNIKIQVLNGTGIAGEAGLLTDQLKNLGYTNVTPGNASDQSNTNTQVTFSSLVSSDVVTEITNKLKTIYTNVTTGNGALSGFDVQVITGLRKGQTSAPVSTSTTAPSPTATPAQ